MFSKEAAFLQKIANSQKVIRQKHLRLKHGLQDVQEEVSKVFKPIVQPLNKMTNAPLKREVNGVPKFEKNEPFSSEEEDYGEKKKPLFKAKKKFHHSTPRKNEPLSFKEELKKGLFHSTPRNNE